MQELKHTSDPEVIEAEVLSEEESGRHAKKEDYDKSERIDSTFAALFYAMGYADSSKDVVDFVRELARKTILYGGVILSPVIFFEGVFATYILREITADRNPYVYVCENAVPGTWTIAATGVPANMAEYAGKTVWVDVKSEGSFGKKVEFSLFPGDCLVDKAPRAIAAEHPTNADVVSVTYLGETTESNVELHFQPSTKGSNALQQRHTDVGAIHARADHWTWLTCESPVSEGCMLDSADIAKAAPRMN